MSISPCGFINFWPDGLVEVIICWVVGIEWGHIVYQRQGEFHYVF